MPLNGRAILQKGHHLGGSTKTHEIEKGGAGDRAGTPGQEFGSDGATTI